MKIIAECRDRIMAVDDDSEFDELSYCRVYNISDDILAPRLRIGSWTARVFPWEKPSRSYEKELSRIEEIIAAERK